MTKKLTLTKREAIKECKELWKEIKVSGLSKEGFLQAPEGQLWVDKGRFCYCPLCEYANQQAGGAPGLNCEFCPLVTQYGRGCYPLGFTDFAPPTAKWLKAIEGLK